MQDCTSLAAAPRVLSSVQEFGKPTDPFAAAKVSAPNAEITSVVPGALVVEGAGLPKPGTMSLSFTRSRRLQ